MRQKEYRKMLIFKSRSQTRECLMYNSFNLAECLKFFNSEEKDKDRMYFTVNSFYIAGRVVPVSS